MSLALPPVGWQRTVLQEPHSTTVWACTMLHFATKLRKYVREHSGNVIASWALNVHEEGVRALKTQDYKPQNA